MDDTPTVVITGASDGIGAEAARIVAQSGARVVVVGRSPEKTRLAAERAGTPYAHVADFARLDEVRRLACELRESVGRIDVLAHNAGGVFSGPSITEDGHERTFQVNHLAPVLLTRLLLDRLIDARATVVHTASVASRVFARVDFDDFDSARHFRAHRAYGNAKLANVVTARTLAERYGPFGLSSFAFHPGVVATNFASDTSSALRWAYGPLLRRWLSSSAEGGATLAQFIDPAVVDRWESGGYYLPSGRRGRILRAASSSEFRDRHWARTNELLRIDWPDVAPG